MGPFAGSILSSKPNFSAHLNFDKESEEAFVELNRKNVRIILGIVFSSILLFWVLKKPSSGRIPFFHPVPFPLSIYYGRSHRFYFEYPHESH